MFYKYLSILVQLIALSNTAYTQDIFPDETQNQEWEYVTWNFWGGYCEKRIIKTGAAIALCGRQYIEVFDCNEQEQNCLRIGFYRIQNDSVLVRPRKYYWNGPILIDSVDCDQPEGLMYDFGVPTGDTLSCMIDGALTPKFSDFWKVHEQTLEYEGVTRKTLSMDFRPYPFSPFIVYNMKWITGIGSNIHPFYALSCIGDHCEWEQQLTRVFRNGALIYQDTTLSFSFPCTKWVTETKNALLDSGSMELYPNPAISGFYLKSNLDSSARLDLSIYDQYGKLVYTRLNHPNKEGIDTGFMEPGIYYVQIRGEGIFECIKLVKI